MRKTIAAAACALSLICIAASDSRADQPAVLQAADHSQLPPALAALRPNPEDILSHDEASQVRGQWLLNVNLPLVAAVIQGQGSFELNMLTLSGGVFAGNPVVVRIRIGR